MSFGKILKRFILPIGDKISGQSVMAQYRFFSKAQWWSYEKLIEYQKIKLIDTIHSAYNDTIFYKEIYKAINIRDIQSIQDLSKLPIVSKRMIRQYYPDGCIRKVKGSLHEFFTSGSSGEPFAVTLDSYTLSIARALMLLRATYSGWNIGDRSLQTGMTLKRGPIKFLKDIALRVEYVSAFNLSDIVLDSYLELIDKKKIDFIMGYASSLYCLAKRACNTGFNRPLKGIVSWGDNMFAHYRKQIEKQFQCKVTDTYGCGEGVQIASQCKEGQYHIFSPHVIVEFVNKNGNQCEDDETGEILITRLNPGAMPLIRYRIGDIGKKGIKKTCPCGRVFELMESIEGRDSDIIMTPNGNRLIVHFFTGIFEYETTIDTFQIVQEKIGEITIKIVPLPGFNDDVVNNLKRQILEKGDKDLKIEFAIVHDIPLERSNKRRFVVSRL